VEKEETEGTEGFGKFGKFKPAESWANLFQTLDRVGWQW